MMLRLQTERMEGRFIASPREYRHLYGLTPERLVKRGAWGAGDASRGR